MAAPCRVCGVLRLAEGLARLDLGPRGAVVGCQVLQVRHKKGAGRYRAPPTHKTKEKWVYQGRKTRMIETVKMKRVLMSKPEDDVWMERYYEPQTFDLLTAIQMHREFAQPAMLNNTKGLLQLDMQLDLRTKKKTKFMNIIRETVRLPHEFEDGTENKVMVFVKDNELRKVAEDLGAVFVGGIDLVKTIEKGEIRYDDFNQVVVHLDMLSDLGSIRKFLRDNFPHKNKGNLGTNLKGMVEHFLFGKTYESEKKEEAVGTLKINLGRLNMTDTELSENFDTYMESICSHRSPSLGPFITSGHLSCPPSPEQYPLSPKFLRPVDQRSAVQAELEQEVDEPEAAPDDSDDEQTADAKRQ